MSLDVDHDRMVGGPRVTLAVICRCARAGEDPPNSRLLDEVPGQFKVLGPRSRIAGVKRLGYEFVTPLLTILDL